MPVKEQRPTIANMKELTPVKSKGVTMDMQCTHCSLQLDLSSYFAHAKEVHGVFSCLYCLRFFKFSKELMVHLTREHRVTPQKYDTGAEFLDRGGSDVTLLCVECNKIFQSDALVTFMKHHTQECRKSTGICIKCGSVQPLSLLGEHMLQCQGSMNVNLQGSVTITTSQLRSRDNSCKYCGKKFSPSKIAAHMRACSVRSTKSAYNNIWNCATSDREETIKTLPEESDNWSTNKRISPSSPSKAKSPAKIESAAKSASVVLTSNFEKTTGRSRRNIRNISVGPSILDSKSLTKKNGPPVLLSPSKIVGQKSDPYSPSPSPKTSPKKESVPFPKISNKKTSPSKDSSTKTLVSRRNKPQSHCSSPSLEQETLTSTPIPTPEIIPEPKIEEPVDPLLREIDDDQKLSILIQELADKLIEVAPKEEVLPLKIKLSENMETSITTASSAPKYNLIVNYNLERRTDDGILNDMVLKSSADCAYCKLVRLIRIDKRQLVIHLLSKHLWDIRIIRTPPAQGSVSDAYNTSAIKVEAEGKEESRDEDMVTAMETGNEEAECENQNTDNPVNPLAVNCNHENKPPTEEGCDTNHAHSSSIKDSPGSAPALSLSFSEEIKSSTEEDASGKVLPTTTPTVLLDVAEDKLTNESNNTEESQSMFSPVTTPAMLDLNEENCNTNNAEESSSTDCHSPPQVSDSLASPSKCVSEQTSPKIPSVKFSGNSTIELKEGALEVQNNDGSETTQQELDKISMETKNQQGFKSNMDVSDGPVVDKSCQQETKIKKEVEDCSADKCVESGGENLARNGVQEVNEAIKSESNVDTLPEDYNIPLDLSWHTFKMSLLHKVFRSSNIVFTFTGEYLGEFGEIPCECLICGFFTDSQKNLFPHWRRTHRGVAMKCTMCRGSFLFAGALYSHLCLGTPEPLTLKEKEVEDEQADGSETVGLRYQCGMCENMQLPGFFNYMVHLRKDHNKCELCLESHQSQRDLEYHMRKHKLNHFCWKCNLSYCAKPNLMTHLFWKHGTESVDCSKCLKKKWPHMYHFCLPPEYFVCDVCGISFTRPMSLLVHQRLHTGLKLKRCPKTSCQERFISKKLLQKHLEVAHAKVNANALLPAAATESAVVEKMKCTSESKEHLQTVAEIKPQDVSELSEMNIGAVDGNDNKNDLTDQPENTETNPKNATETATITEPEDSLVHESCNVPQMQLPQPAPDEAEKLEEQSVANESQDLPDSTLSSVKVSDNPESLENGEFPTTTISSFSVDESQIPSPSNGNCQENSEIQPDRTPSPMLPVAKPFNMADIQGPNLSEDESESDLSDSENVKPEGNSPINTLMDGNSFQSRMPELNISESEEDNDDSHPNGEIVPETDSLMSSPRLPENHIPPSETTLRLDLEAEFGTEFHSSTSSLSSGLQPINKETIDADVISVGSAAVESYTAASVIPPVNTDEINMLSGGEKTKSGDEFSAMSPLLPPLEDFDFSVPEIPTFEENHLPEHIIQENAMFSIQHEHDYCSPNFLNTGGKRKSSSPAYSHGHLYYGLQRTDSSKSPTRGSPAKKPKNKIRKISPKKVARKRARSSSSSSSSSSSCSSCGSNCSCSSSSSGSSSSSSSSDSESGSSDVEITPKKKSKSKSPKKLSRAEARRKAEKPASAKTPSGTENSVSIVNNGKITKLKLPKPPTKRYKRTKGARGGKSASKEVVEESENVEPVKKEPENIIPESDLETDESGSEEVFHKKQLTEITGTVPLPVDHVWSMGSEKYLLKLVRGVESLEELRPPPPLPAPKSEKKIAKKERVKYILKNNGPVQPKLKVRNVPIKPLIVKRNVHSGEISNVNEMRFTSEIAMKCSSPSPHLGNNYSYIAEELETPISSSGRGIVAGASEATSRRLPSKGRKSSATPVKAVKGVKAALTKNKKHNLDEKLYCICQCPHDNVSKMIGCDSKDCQYKWFHFECVGICIPPKGKWFCSECREIRRQKAAARAAAKAEPI